MDKKQGSDDVVKRDVDDDDTEAQRFKSNGIPADDEVGPDAGAKRGVVTDEGDDTAGQRFRGNEVPTDEPAPDEGFKRN